MADKIIEIQVKSNLPEVTKDFKNLNDQIQETNSGLDSIQSNVDTSASSIKKVTTETEKHSTAVKKNTQGVLENGGAVGILNELTGGLASTVKDAAESTSLFSKEGIIGAQVQKAYAFVVGTSTGAMKGFRIALASTGVGLLVIGLGLLVANFDKVQEYVQKGIDKFKGLGEGTKTLISVLFPLVGVVRLVTLGLEKMGVIDDDIAKKQKENAEKRIKSLNKEKLSIEEKYDREIRLAEAAGKDTVALEAAKRKAILQTLQALNDAEGVRIKSGEATKEEIKTWNDRQTEIKKIVVDGEVAKVAAIKDGNDKAKEARDKSIDDNKKANEKAYEADKKALDEKLSQEGLSFKQRRDLIAADRMLSKEDRKKYNADVAKDEEKERQDIAKKKLDNEMASAKQAIDIVNTLKQNVETPAQKEEREYLEKKLVLEANHLSTEELTRQHIIRLNDISNEAFAKEAEDAIAATEKRKEKDAELLDQKKGLYSELSTAAAEAAKIFEDGTKEQDALNEASLQIAKVTADGKIETMEAVSAGAAIASKLFSKHTVAAKALGIASTTIDTYKGIMSIWGAASMGNPIVDVAVKTASSAIVAAQGIASVKNILKVKVPGGDAGGTPPTPPTAGPTPTAPPTSTPLVDLQQRNNNNNLSGSESVTMAPAQQIVVKAVVSETEISKSQQTVANIRTNSEL